MKKWWKKHWDGVLVIAGTILGFYLIFKANGRVK